MQAYIIFIAQNACAVTGVAWRWFVLALAIPLCVLMSFKRMKKLSFISLAGSIALLASCIIIMVYCLTTELSMFQQHATLRTLEEFDIKTLPLYFGVVCYAFEGIGLVVVTKKAMKDPTQYMRTMTVSYGVVWCGVRRKKKAAAHPRQLASPCFSAFLRRSAFLPLATTPRASLWAICRKQATWRGSAWQSKLPSGARGAACAGLCAHPSSTALDSTALFFTYPLRKLFL